ncbi:hypothetical protein L9F63_000191, partial [Diploptera punctata]
TNLFYSNFEKIRRFVGFGRVIYDVSCSTLAPLVVCTQNLSTFSSGSSMAYFLRKLNSPSNQLFRSQLKLSSVKYKNPAFLINEQDESISVWTGHTAFKTDHKFVNPITELPTMRKYIRMQRISNQALVSYYVSK